VLSFSFIEKYLGVYKMNYQHILLTIDYSEHGDYVLQKGQSLAKLYAAKLSLVHVLDNIPMPQVAYGTIISLTEPSDNALLEAEKTKFIQVADKLGINQDSRWMVWGNPKQEITHIAAKENVDLVVVGSHGRHGLALLLGSTANAVLHYANCDVLAVRLQDFPE
jgi:universal stress protein A